MICLMIFEVEEPLRIQTSRPELGSKRNQHEFTTEMQKPSDFGSFCRLSDRYGMLMRYQSAREVVLLEALLVFRLDLKKLDFDGLGSLDFGPHGLQAVM